LYLAEHHTLPAVVVLSFVGNPSQSVDEAIQLCLDKGLHVVAAAGNLQKDACNFSPAGLKGVITVGSTDSDDHFSEFSNYGECVTVLAPGKDILVFSIGEGPPFERMVCVIFVVFMAGWSDDVQIQ
jgi:subtilisin family serine protease